MINSQDQPDQQTVSNDPVKPRRRLNTEPAQMRPRLNTDAIQPRCRLNTDLRSRGYIPRRKASKFTLELTKTRAQLNAEIVKELRIKEGCENLLKVLPKKEKTRKKDTEVVLSFSEAKLSNLRRELHQLNESLQTGIKEAAATKYGSMRPGAASTRSSVSTTAGEPSSYHAPLIAIGCKTTEELNYKKIFSKMLRSHYKEDPEKFDPELTAINNIRKRVQTPERSDDGLEDIFTYYHALIYAEHRFFLEEKNEDVTFQWYDVFTGKVAIQQSVALEKACVAFNAAATATQIASEKDLDDLQEISEAKEYLEMAGGCFDFILSHFTNAPTDDLSYPSLKLLQTLSLAQAQECMWLLHCAENAERGDTPHFGEAAAVAQQYTQALELFEAPEIEELMIPEEWKSIIDVKHQYFHALANFHWVNSKLEETEGVDDHHAEDMDDVKESLNLCVLRVEQSLRMLQSAREKCREDIPHQVGLKAVLRKLSRNMKRLKTELGLQVKDKPNKSRNPLQPLDGSPSSWSFGECAELFELPNDPFERLGPLYFFNSMCSITNRRTVVLTCKEGQTFGIRIGGDGPLSIVHVAHGSVAYHAGVMAGNYILCVNGEDVRNAEYDQVIQLVKFAVDSNHVELELVENIDMQNFEELAEDGWGDEEAIEDDIDEDMGDAEDEEIAEEDHGYQESPGEMPVFRSVFADARNSTSGSGFKTLFMRSLRKSRRKSKRPSKRMSVLPGEKIEKNNPLVVGEVADDVKFDAAASIGIHPLKKRSADNDDMEGFSKRLSRQSFDA